MANLGSAAGGTAASDVVLRGELFKAGKDGGNFKVRWFELSKKGELSWAESDSTQAKGSQPMLHCQIVLDKIEKAGKGDVETRYGFSIHPPGVGFGRQHKLQASSLEERQLWVDQLERAAHPDVQRAVLFSGGRIVTMSKPAAKGRLGLELADSFSLTPGGACVTVTAIEENAAAAEAGLLVGDVIISMGPTVLRNHSVALRSFCNAVGEMTLRLAVLTREAQRAAHRHAHTPPLRSPLPLSHPSPA